jgi:predicted O-linked N-acetylglucosamine transferase (SPINDLY family)
MRSITEFLRSNYIRVRALLGENALPDASVTAPATQTSNNDSEQFAQAQAFHQQMQLDEAEAIYRSLLQKYPNDFDLLHMLGVVQGQRSNFAAAIVFIEQAIAIDPNNAAAHGSHGNCLKGLGRFADALDSYGRALALQPNDANTLNNRGATLGDLRRPTEALESYDRALAINPTHVLALDNRGAALRELQRPAEALVSHSKALALKPDFAEAHSNKIVCMNNLPEFGFVEYQEEMHRWYESHGKGLTRTPPPRKPNAQSRRLVVGYVSADFRAHSATAAFGPVLRHHDKSRFEIVCYSGVVVEDALTHGFRQLADRWYPIAGMTDEVLSTKIAADGIDILVDLSGHSAGNRLLTFAHKPAPVQVTAWGYATGTGLPTIDYFFSDPVATPPAVRPLFAETVYDLPCFLTFDPPAYAPPVSEAPVQRQGVITFGCLNGFHKVSKSNLEQWAQILQAVPHSRLLMKDTALAAPANQLLVRQAMAKYGISPERIELRGGSSHQDHLAAYGDVDIALDPFPYNGGITTWEALWMGVPVVSKLGNSSSGRSGGAILSALGLSDWVVSGEPEYVALAADKAARTEELVRFRREIRAVISSSAAGNSALYTRAVETAFMKMWHDYATTASRTAF